jgi:hypothetical protein
MDGRRCGELTAWLRVLDRTFHLSTCLTAEQEATEPRLSSRGLETERAMVEHFISTTWPASTQTGIVEAIRALWSGARDGALQCCSEPNARLVMRTILIMVYAMDAQMPRHGAHTIGAIHAAVRRLYATAPTAMAYGEALQKLVVLLEAQAEKHRERGQAVEADHAQGPPQAKYFFPGSNRVHQAALHALVELGSAGRPTAACLCLFPFACIFFWFRVCVCVCVCVCVYV